MTMSSRPSAPTTPRSPALGTPRTASRRLTTNTTPSRPFHAPTFAPPILPSLSPRPYPTTPYADDPDFASQRQADIATIDYAVNIMRSSSSARRTALAGMLAEIEEEKRRVEEAAKSLGEVAREMVKSLAREREEGEQARELEAEVLQRGRALKVQVEGIRADIAEAEAKLLARRELKAKQRDAFQRQASKNGPEIAFFEEKLGLKMRGSGRDIVRFKFSQVDPASYNRAFSFDIDASKPTYTLTALSPPSFLPSTVLAPLLTSLNASRDFYGFARAMRRAFRDEIRVEKMGFGAGAEGEKEREKERERVRGETK